MSSVATPTVTSATYDYSTSQLVVTGTNFVAKSGGANDVDISLLAFTGEGGATYDLISATDVEIASTTQFSVTLSGADIYNVEALLNKDGTAASSGTTYNLAANEDWMVGTDSPGGAINAKRFAAKETSEGHTFRMLGTIRAALGEPLSPTGPIVVSIGDATPIEIPLAAMEIQTDGPFSRVKYDPLAQPVEQLEAFSIHDRKARLLLRTRAIPNSGLPLSAGDEVEHMLTLKIEIPTAGGTFQFSTIIKATRVSPNVQGWRNR